MFENIHAHTHIQFPESHYNLVSHVESLIIWNKLLVFSLLYSKYLLCRTKRCENKFWENNKDFPGSTLWFYTVAQVWDRYFILICHTAGLDSEQIIGRCLKFTWFGLLQMVWFFQLPESGRLDTLTCGECSILKENDGDVVIPFQLHTCTHTNNSYFLVYFLTEDQEKPWTLLKRQLLIWYEDLKIYFHLHL